MRYSCLENSIERGATGGLQSMGICKSGRSDKIFQLHRVDNMLEKMHETCVLGSNLEVDRWKYETQVGKAGN